MYVWIDLSPMVRHLALGIDQKRLSAGVGHLIPFILLRFQYAVSKADFVACIRNHRKFKGAHASKGFLLLLRVDADADYLHVCRRQCKNGSGALSVIGSG